MDKLIKTLLDKAAKEGTLHVVTIGTEEPDCDDCETFAECKGCECDACEDSIVCDYYEPEIKETESMKDAREIAIMNKDLFDAHVAVGFTEKQAMQLVNTIIKG